jgi:hydrogenase-4 component E
MTDTFLVFLVLTNFMLFAASRLDARIRLMAMQGVLLGLLTILLHTGALTMRTWVLAAGSAAIKAGVFPWLLERAIRETNVRRTVEPFVGYTASLLIGTLLLGISFWLGARLPLPQGQADTLVVPVALFSILSGLFFITSRKTALAQVLGYLVLENGIYAFGIALALEQSLLVELGITLDLLVGVFVMGIAIFHISREFDHIDVGRMSVLKDYEADS